MGGVRGWSKQKQLLLLFEKLIELFLLWKRLFSYEKTFSSSSLLPSSAFEDVQPIGRLNFSSPSLPLTSHSSSLSDYSLILVVFLYGGWRGIPNMGRSFNSSQHDNCFNGGPQLSLTDVIQILLKIAVSRCNKSSSFVLLGRAFQTFEKKTQIWMCRIVFFERVALLIWSSCVETNPAWQFCNNHSNPCKNAPLLITANYEVFQDKMHAFLRHSSS